jgi:uridylate kinase
MDALSDPAAAEVGAKAPRFKRVVLKISGEALRKPNGVEPIDPDILQSVCEQLKEISELGVQVAVVIGGGNIFRGLGRRDENRPGVERTTGDYMGMLATVINGLALMDGLEKIGVTTRVQTSIPMEQVAEPFILRRAIRHLEKGRVVLFVAGTGNPFFTTDTTAALRASEIGAEVILKATKVDGVYDKDPMTNEDAVRYQKLTYRDAIKQRLSVMDQTAFSMCEDNDVPILVFNLFEPGAIRSAVMGGDIGTLVHASES